MRSDKENNKTIADAFNSLSEGDLQEMRNLMAIVAKIHDVMNAKGVSQKELAAKMDKSESEISKWLSGSHNLTLRSIAKLEVALGEAILFHDDAEQEEKKPEIGLSAAINEKYRGTASMSALYVSHKGDKKQINAA